MLHVPRLMVVLGIDPGLARLGFGTIARERGAIRFLEAGVITTPSTASIADRLATLLHELEALVARAKPDRIALERVFLVPGVTLHRIGEVRGVILAVSGRSKIPVEEISPTAVKALTSGSGRAEKMQMRKSVQRILGLVSLPLADAADALALAIMCGGASREIPRP